MENDRESERARERARKGLEFMTNVEYENIHTHTHTHIHIHTNTHTHTHTHTHTAPGEYETCIRCVGHGTVHKVVHLRDALL